MATQDFAPMSIGQILSRASRLYMHNFLRCIIMVALLQVPVLVLSDIVMGLLKDAMGAAKFGEVPGLTLWLGTLLAFLVMFFLCGVARALWAGSLTQNFLCAVLGRQISVLQAYRAAWAKLWTLFWAGILCGLAVFGGLILLVIPGVIFSLWFIVTTPAIVLENQGPIKAMRRSKALVSGNVGRALVLFLVLIFLCFAINMICAYCTGMIGHWVAGASYVPDIQAKRLGGDVTLILMTPLLLATSVIFYIDLRVRKEGFNIQMLAKGMGAGGVWPDAITQIP